MKTNSDPKAKAAPANSRPSSALLSWLLQRHVWGALLTIIGLLTILFLVSGGEGRISRGWSLMLRQMFGLGAYPMALLILVSGIIILGWEALPMHRRAVRWQTIVGLEVVFLSALGIIHRFGRSDPLELALAGKWGGMVGWLWWQAFVPVVGELFSLALMLMILAGGVALALGPARRTVYARVRRVWGVVWRRFGELIHIPQTAIRSITAPQARASTLEPEPEFLRPASPAQAAPRAAPQPALAAPARTAPRPVAPRAAPRPTETRTKILPTASGLPSLDMLIMDQAEKGDDADARMRAQIIEETLEAFGIPVEVLEWHRGPVVTQFGVEPGYIERQDRDGVMRRFKIRVSKILSLSNDLALALAAAPIRIEAPVPGRAVVGIEVPNDTKTLVGLRGVLESNVFRKARPALALRPGARRLRASRWWPTSPPCRTC